MERASSAAVNDAARAGRSVTTAQDRTVGDAGSVGAGSSKMGPNRGLPPPALAWAASALANAWGTTESSTRAEEAAPRCAPPR